MNTKLFAGGTLAGLVMAGGVAGMASAQSVAEQTGLTEKQVIEIALLEVPGEVVGVELERHWRKKIYEINILGEDGVEMEVEVSAETGEILDVEAENERDDSEKKMRDKDA